MGLSVVGLSTVGLLNVGVSNAGIVNCGVCNCNCNKIYKITEKIYTLTNVILQESPSQTRGLLMGS